MWLSEMSCYSVDLQEVIQDLVMKGGQNEDTEGRRLTSLHPLFSYCTYYVLSGADLFGQLAALHCTEVQVFVEELSIQDVSHSVL